NVSTQNEIQPRRQMRVEVDVGTDDILGTLGDIFKGIPEELSSQRIRVINTAARATVYGVAVVVHPVFDIKTARSVVNHAEHRVEVSTLPYRILNHVVSIVEACVDVENVADPGTCPQVEIVPGHLCTTRHDCRVAQIRVRRAQ